MQKNNSTTESHEFLRGLATGGLIAMILLSSLFFALDRFGFDDKWSDIVIAIFTVAGTLCAAWLALLGIQNQIQANKNAEVDRLSAALFAERALLPLALSEIMSVATKNLQRCFSSANVNYNKSELSPDDSVSDNTIYTIKKCIEFSDLKSRNRLANILRHYQIVSSRGSQKLKGTICQDADEGDGHQYQLIGRAIDWAVIHALCDQAYDFARGRERVIPTEKVNNRVISAFFLAGITWETFPDLKRSLNSQAAADNFEFDFAAND